MTISGQEAIAKWFGGLEPTVSSEALEAREGVETSTKDERPRQVPVHPTLAKVLAAWKLGGWQRCFGRAPGPDDLIVPNREGSHRNGPRSLLRFHEDLERLGLRKRRQHDCRRTFQSLARGDGGRPDLIDWVTHGPSGSMRDAYTSMPWASLCTEVAKLKVELLEGAKVLDLKAKQAVGAESCDTACDTAPEKRKSPQALRAWRPVSLSGKRDLNPRPPPWQGDALPLSYSR